MYEALYVGATGMQAQQLAVDTIANNVANVNTPGFKKARVAFNDLVLQGAQRATDVDGSRAASRDGSQVAIGVGVSAISPQFDAGDLRKTDVPMDLAIQGEGFIELALPDGTRAFVRGGTLQVNHDGLLANAAGFALKGGISVPDNTRSIDIGRDGQVRLLGQGQSSASNAGRVELVRFVNAAGLIPMGDGMYRASEASGEPVALRVGEEGTGGLMQGFLEGSNVKMVDEMVNLMVAQRAYEANTRIVQASDEMLGLVNGLRK